MKIQGNDVSDANTLEWLVFAFRRGSNVRVIMEMLEQVSEAFAIDQRYCRNDTHITAAERIERKKRL